MEARKGLLLEKGLARSLLPPSRAPSTRRPPCHDKGESFGRANQGPKSRLVLEADRTYCRAFAAALQRSRLLFASTLICRRLSVRSQHA